MQLHYNILWVDNDLQDYIDRDYFVRLNEFLLGYGFIANINPLFDSTELDSVLEKRYDLIISDYDLGLDEENTGIELVKRIREDYLTEILFYTGNFSMETEEKLRNALKYVDRITIHLGRETLLEKIEKTIILTVQKLLELNATRGLITSITSDLDVDMELIAHKIIEATSSDITDKIFESAHKEISKKQSKEVAALQEIFEKKDYKGYFTKADAFRKWGLLKETIKLNIPQNFNYELLKEYYKEVISIRNKFAHAKAIMIEGELHLAGFGPDGTAFQFNEEQCIEIRKKLIGHRDNFNALLKHFAITIN
jgi:CheY-like chemotaxis protein